MLDLIVTMGGIVYGLVLVSVVFFRTRFTEYTRNGAERFDYGNSGGTWWDKLSDSEKENMKRIDLHQAA